MRTAHDWQLITRLRTRLRPSWMFAATYVLLLGVFALVEITYHACGIHFDVSPLNSYWQYLDPQLLRGDLLRSVWYLHSQPPAFNLVVGLVLKISGSHWPVAFHAGYLACGFGLYLGVFELMRRLGVRRVLAMVSATALLVSPSFVLYEHWLFYTLPLATTVTLSLVVLARFLDRPSRPLAAFFSVLLLFLCASQSVYQLPYFLLVVGGVAAWYPAGRRTLLWAAAVPFVLLCAISLKNAFVFGIPTTSSWAGMSLAKMTVGYLSPRAAGTLAASGAISPIALIEPFSPPEAYPDRYFSTGGFDTVPALSARTKSTGAENLNHIGYLRISTIYLRNSLVVLRRYPSTFVAACADAWRIYFWSSAAYRFLEVNTVHIAGWNRFFERVVYGYRPSSGIYVGLLIALLLAVGFPAARLLCEPQVLLQTSVLFACVVFNITYLAIVGNTLEMGENNRFRFTTDGLSVTMLAAGLQLTYDRFRSLWGRVRTRESITSTSVNKSW